MIMMVDGAMEELGKQDLPRVNCGIKRENLEWQPEPKAKSKYLVRGRA